MGHGSTTPPVSRAHGIAVLIATRDRDELLRARSLPSLALQTRTPDYLVVVNDGAPLEPITASTIERAPVRSATFVLTNAQARGVAGAWNTGLAHISELGHTGYVALLDDDDEWDPDHLDINWHAATSNDADGCVTGLRMCFGGIIEPRPFISELRPGDFLVGNPGWQGSNTFVHTRALQAVGGFRLGLQSCNDRDLAIRLLRLPQRRWILVPQWTATWHQEERPTLSSRGSAAKLEGLRQFWMLYGHEMTPAEQDQFFERSNTRFGFGRESVIGFEGQATTPCHRDGASQ
jgi:hypothetical protein